MIVLVGGYLILARSGVKISGVLPDLNSRDTRGKSANGGPAAKNPKLGHSAIITSLVSPLAAKVRLPELTDEQVTRFLADNHRSAQALLTVSRLKGDLALLREAATSFPDDALVQLELALRGATADEKHEALEAFRKLAPSDAVGDYLAALAHFGGGLGAGIALKLPPGIASASNTQGQLAEALEDLAGAASHPVFGVDVTDQIQNAEDLYRGAGYGLLEAKAAALLGQPRTQTATLVMMAGNLVMLYHKYTAAKDDESARTVCQMGLSLSHRLRDESRLLFDDIMGIMIETRLLKQLPEDSTVPESGQSAAARLDALATENEEISDLAKQSLAVLDAMSESEVLTYLQHLNHDGELKALRWLQQNRQ